MFLRWNPADRTKALAWVADQADICPRCHQLGSEWRDEKGVELRDPPYKVVKVRCPSCEMLDEQKDMDKEGEAEHGVSYAFKRITND